MDNSAQYSEMRNILARRATQNVFQTVILDAADLTQKRIFVQPLYPVPNLGQEKVSNWTLHRTLKALARIVEHIRMAQYISQLDHGHDAVLYTMFLNIPAFFTFLFSGFRSKNVYLLAHFVQQCRENRFYVWLFKFYIFLGYKFFVFEDASLLAREGLTEKEMRSFFSIPHPAQDKTSLIAKVKSTKGKKVGLIGYTHPGKQSKQTLELLIRLQNEMSYDLILGTNDISAFKEIQFDDKTIFINTSSSKDYFAALAVCDVLVINYDKCRSYLRSSGVIADAIGTRTYCICPNYPILRQQLVWPTTVGKVFDTIDDLPRVLQEVLNWEDAKTNSAFDLHYQQRSAQTLARIFDKVTKNDQ